ncbi:MCLN3 protein, partial [Peucedramus taeniatus]|nr:MCLN3 protein [Peucedramus taeniatus]
RLILFRLSHQLVVAFKDDNTVAIKLLFPRGYEDGADDTWAIYTRGDILEQLAFVLKKVAWGHQEGGTLGHYAYDGTRGGTEDGTRLRLCQHFFCREDINPSNNTFDTDPSV